MYISLMTLHGVFHDRSFLPDEKSVEKDLRYEIFTILESVFGVVFVVIPGMNPEALMG